MAKTILKLHANGNLETIGIPLTEGQPYSLRESGITIPKIIEYPSSNHRNYFVEKTVVPGYIQHHAKDNIKSGDFLPPSSEKECVSDYIAVDGWGSATVRIRFYNTSDLIPWLSIQSFDTNKSYITAIERDNFGTANSSYYMFESKFAINSGFIRVSSSHWDYNGSRVEMSVQRGDITNTKQYLSFEDMPSWVRDTGNPISFFQEGVVIKGDVM